MTNWGLVLFEFGVILVVHVSWLFIVARVEKNYWTKEDKWTCWGNCVGAKAICSLLGTAALIL